MSLHSKNVRWSLQCLRSPSMSFMCAFIDIKHIRTDNVERVCGDLKYLFFRSWTIVEYVCATLRISSVTSECKNCEMFFSYVEKFTRATETNHWTAENVSRGRMAEAPKSTPLSLDNIARAQRLPLVGSAVQLQVGSSRVINFPSCLRIFALF